MTSAGSFLTLAELRAKHGDPADRYLDLAGASIRYRDEGQGPAVVLLHGSYGSLASWDEVARSLVLRFRVLRFDMPGMGLSDSVPDPAPGSGGMLDGGAPGSAVPESAPGFGDDVLAALLDHVGVERATVVGVSSGGSIGYWFAARFPDRVNALIVANAPANPLTPPERSPDLAAEFALAAATGFKRRAYWEVYLRWLAGDPARVRDAVVEKYYDLNRREPEPGVRSFWRLSNEPARTQGTLAAVAAPTLLVWGARDLVLPLPALDALAGYLTGTQVSRLVLPDVGHYPPIEVPGRFADIVTTYLDAVLP